MTIFDPEAFDPATSIHSLLEGTPADPKLRHDLVRQVIDGLVRTGRPVPVNLRNLIEELEAEIAESYFNNVPV